MYPRMIRLEVLTAEYPTLVLLSLVDASSPFGVMPHPLSEKEQRLG